MRELIAPTERSKKHAIRVLAILHLCMRNSMASSISFQGTYARFGNDFLCSFDWLKNSIDRGSY